MSLLENLLTPGTIERLGWMLVHILWQATAVAILLAVFLRLLRNGNANVRYGIACSALALMVALPIVTIHLMKAPGPAAEAGPSRVVVTLPPEEPAPLPAETMIEVGEEMPASTPASTPLPAADLPLPAVPLRERIVSTLEPALPYVVLGWLVGVFGLSAWHLGGWAQLQRLRRRMVREVGCPLQQRLEELSIRLGVRRAVGLLESALIEVPTVVGWLRPVILLPASALTGLRPEQLEAILAHELAHVRRYDYLVNIVQTVVEILGFYHPAVWWVSRRIRIERENCCDDLAVHVCGSSLQYAKALACMEEIRHSGRELAMAATGGSLMARIARLLGRPTVDDRRFAWLPGLVALLLVVGVILPAALVLGTPQRPQTVAPATVTATSVDPTSTEPNDAPGDVKSGGVPANGEAVEVLLDFRIAKALDELRVDRETMILMANALGAESRLTREYLRPGQKLDLTLGEILKRYVVPQSLSPEAVEAMINLLQSRGYLNVSSKPRLLVLDGKQAQMRITGQRSLPASDPSGKIEIIEYGTIVNATPHVLDSNHVALKLMAEISNLVPGPDANQPTVARTSAATDITASNDRYLIWAAVAPAAAPAGQEADQRSVYIMVKPHINLPPQGLALAPDERRPDGTPPRHVLLSVRTVTLDSGALESLGVQWSDITGGPSASVRTGAAVDETFTGALLTALDRLQADHQATVSSQQIIVQERYQSQIRTLRNQWSAGAQPHKTETGTVVKVRPHVANDNTIRLDVTIDATRQLPTPPGSDLPMQSSQTCQTTIALQDGGTAAIAGLSGNGTQGRPGQETVIFVTTHLLPDRKETPVGTPQAAGPDTRVTPPVSLTPEQTASMRREYVNSDPMVNELSKSIVAIERDLITQQALVKEHPRLSQEQAALVDLKDKLVSRRRELEKEFDNGLTARTGGSLDNRTENGKRTTITATFTNADLVGVLAEIAQRAGVKITPDATVKATPVTTELADASVEAALQQVLKDTHYTFRKVNDGTYLVFRPLSNSFLGSDLGMALRDVAMMAGVPIVMDLNVSGTVTASFENVSLDEALELVLAGKPYAFKKTPRYYLVARRSLTSQAFSDISVTRRVRLNHVRPAQVTQRLSPVFAPYVQAEQPNPGDPNGQGNVLLITAAPAMADRIEADIKQIDRVRRQVLLDARVVVMEKGNLLNLGVEWSWPTTQAGAFANSGIVGSTGTATGGQPYSIQIGRTPDQTFTNSLMMALNLLQENKQADIIANPKVVAQDGRQAEMKVIEEEWFAMTGPATKDGSDTRPELQKIESGTVLAITPCIGDNNDITLQMAVEISDIIPKTRGSDLPVVTRRTAKNTVTVKDGGTAAVGGLTDNRGKMTYKRVPVLGSIPLVGGLFRSRTNEQSNREVAVFVTAHLVPDVDRVPLQPAASVETKAQVQKVVNTAEGEQTPPVNEGTSRAWSILRQWNCPPLLLGLTPQLTKVLEPSRRNDPVWQEVADGGTLRLRLDVEGGLPGEVIVGLFQDAAWLAEPVAVRRLGGAGTHTLKGLPAGRYQIGAMIGGAPVPVALGVQRTWPEPIEIQRDQTATADVLVSEAFQNWASGWYNEGVAKDYLGQWGTLNETNLLQGQLTGPDGKPIPFGLVEIRQHNPGARSTATADQGTNEQGLYKYDGMDWPYQVTALWRQAIPSAFGYRRQRMYLSRVLEGPQRMDFRFEPFPEGTAKVAGRLIDQNGKPVRGFFLRVHMPPFSDLDLSRLTGGYKTQVTYDVPFISEDGRFELGGLPAGRATVDVIPFEVQRYQHERGQDVVLEAGETARVDVELLGKGVFHGRVLFEDGTPAVITPAPWRGAATRILMTFGPRAGSIGQVSPDGYFTLYLGDSDTEALAQGNSRLVIDVPSDQQRRWDKTGEFPYEKLAQDKSRAGVVTVKRPRPAPSRSGSPSRQ